MNKFLPIFSSNIAHHQLLFRVTSINQNKKSKISIGYIRRTAMIFEKIKTLLLFAIILISSYVYAGDTGKLAGKVTDKSNTEPLIGANIVITSVWVDGQEQVFGQLLGAATDMNGDYYILNIPPGTYNVKVSYIGYRPEIKTKVKIVADRTTRIDFELYTESYETKEVVVTAYAPETVEKDLTATKRTYNINEIQNLPGINDIDDILRLQADVIEGHFRGGRTGEATYIVSGSSISNPLTNEKSFEPIRMALDQVEVYTSGFSAEYGNVQSGVINIIQKEGGSVWQTNLEAAGTNSYYKTFGGSIYGRQSQTYFEMLNNPDEWLDGTDPTSGKILWAYFGMNFPENYLPPVPLTFPPTRLTRADSLRTSELARKMWLQSLKDINLEYDKPDYRFNFSIGGPLTKNLNLFFATTQNVVNPFLPSVEQDVQRQVMSNLVFRPSGEHKFKATFNYNHQNRNVFTSNLFNWFERQLHVTFNTLESRQTAFEWNYFASKSTFYDFQISNLNLKEEDRVNLLKEYSDEFQEYSNWRFYTSPSGQEIGKLNTSSGKSLSNTYNLIANITSQLNTTNLLKGGLIFSYYDIDVNNRLGSTNASSLTTESYHVFPYEGAFYLQDKLEFEGLIANLGLRLDYYNFNNTYYKDKYSPYRNPNFDPTNSTSPYYDKTLAASDKTKIQTVLQPRIGLAFPVSEQTVLHLNYGVFTQRPAFEYIYINQFKSERIPDYVRLGNPELKPERTIMYDLGIVRAIPGGFQIDLSAYLKDVSNLIQHAIYVDIGGNQYQTFDNREYADIKGFNISVEKYSSWLNGFIRYNWELTTGKSAQVIGPVSRAVFYENDPARTIIPAPEDIPLDYDRTHKLIGNISIISPEDFGFSFGEFKPLANISISATYKFASGRPFTWDATGQGLRYNQRTPNENDLQLRINKTFSIKNVNFNIYLEGYNILNEQHYNYNRTFSEGPENPYRQRYMENKEEIFTETEFAPYVTDIEAYLIGNQPRHFRLGVTVKF